MRFIEVWYGQLDRTEELFRLDLNRVEAIGPRLTSSGFSDEIEHAIYMRSGLVVPVSEEDKCRVVEALLSPSGVWAKKEATSR